MAAGCKLNQEGVWKYNLRCVAPKALLPYLVTQFHSLGHIGVDKIVYHFVGKWWNPGVGKEAEAVVANCNTCMENNTKGRVKVQTRQAPAPPGPFRHLQVDYIMLPKCKGHEDVLVIVDRFSQWVEASPTKKGF
jgi:hypothetical protein